MKPSLDLALDYLAFNPGRYLFPIKAGSKTPPLIEDNLARASNDPEQIKAWHKKWPGCNWGLALRMSKLIVVDVDQKPGKSGAFTYSQLELLYGWPETESVKTPSGGLHHYYDGEHIFALGVHGFGKDIDSPNYVLIPGSTLADGNAYEALNTIASVPAPDWFAEFLKPHVRVESDAEAVVEWDQDAHVDWAINYLQHDAPPAIEGQGGEMTTLKVAMVLRDHAISEHKAGELMLEFYNVPGVCDPEWDTDALLKKINNAYNYANMRQPGAASAEAEFSDDPPPEPPTSPARKKAEKNRAAEKAANAKLNDRTPDDRKAILENALTRVEGTDTYADLCHEWVYITTLDRMIWRGKPDKNILKTEVFDKRYAYVAGKKDKSVTKKMFNARKNTVRKPTHLTFRPGKPEFCDGGREYNLYRPSEVVPLAGDTTLWREHLEYLFPEPVERGHVLNWCAWLLQNLDKKPKHALLIAGHVQGTGKSFIAEVLQIILGEQNVSPVGSAELSSTFNKWALGCKLIWIEELRALDRRDVAQKLHPIITQDVIPINDKGVQTYKTTNCFGVMAMTNDDAAISLDNSDRRYLVARTEALPRDAAYYDRLYRTLTDPAAIAAIAWELQTRDVGTYSGSQRAPETAAKAEMIEAGLDDIEHWMVEHAHEPPLNGRLTRIDDVIDILPGRVNKTQRLANRVASILKYRFKGMKLGQHRLVNGSRASLWAINGTGLSKMHLEEGMLGAMYEKDRAKAGGKQTADTSDAADDFAD